MSAPDFYAEMRALRLERVLDASVEIITEQGWDGLSMTAVAKRSGVPRQSLYKEVGTREELGSAVVHREVERFLERVRTGLAEHPDDFENGVSAAVRNVLEHGRSNAALAAVLRPGHDSGLLALVTVTPDAVLGQATSALESLLDGAVSEALVDTVVRLTLSHLVQPTVDVDEAVRRIDRVVRGFD
ncbi:TetR family transcriptional regulator [Williamsia serinedens]|uniref:Transcriptional regulator, TetR family n=1 Tax=Williamsia serinedens TaxID=391736 RepID=A0ABT1GX54_9NOCA|nr:TetR family transcriptional regulator [Williamsia serinedens]MCP2159572.1 transcriptional regulator, TetR family [Williamsia serinedens]